MVDILDVLNHFVRLRIFFRFLMANDFPSHPMLSPDFSCLQTLGPFPVIFGGFVNTQMSSDQGPLVI